MLYYILYFLYLFHILLYRVIAPTSFFRIIKMCSLCLWQLRYYSIATPPFPTFATDTLPLLCNEAEQEHKLRHRKPKDNDNAITAAAGHVCLCTMHHSTLGVLLLLLGVSLSLSSCNTLENAVKFFDHPVN